MPRPLCFALVASLLTSAVGVVSAAAQEVEAEPVAPEVVLEEPTFRAFVVSEYVATSQGFRVGLGPCLRLSRPGTLACAVSSVGVDGALTAIPEFTSPEPFWSYPFYQIDGAVLFLIERMGAELRLGYQTGSVSLRPLRGPAFRAASSYMLGPHDEISVGMEIRGVTHDRLPDQPGSVLVGLVSLRHIFGPPREVRSRTATSADR